MSKNGGLISSPCAAVDLSARNTSYIYNSCISLNISHLNSTSFGAYLKYKYPPNSSSLPSPLSITLTLVLLAIYSLNIYIGTEALIVVVSYVSKLEITDDKESRPSLISLITKCHSKLSSPYFCCRNLTIKVALLTSGASDEKPNVNNCGFASDIPLLRILL